MAKKTIIRVKDVEIKSIRQDDVDFISSTDIAKLKNEVDPNGVPPIEEFTKNGGEVFVKEFVKEILNSMNEEQQYLNFDEYIKASEPHKRERAEAWRVAIGLQAVDEAQLLAQILP